MSQIVKQIINETQTYRYTPITIVPGLFFDQWTTINTIHFYYNSQFMTGAMDDEGDRKYFYNIVKNPCNIFEKSIDFDTKNIKCLTTGGGRTEKTWFFQRDLNYWMREQKFGQVLNRLFHELPIFGSVVIKIVEGVPYFVDLRNFIIEKSADSLDDSNYIIEQHNMTVADFRKKAKIMKWKQSDVDEVIERFHEGKYSHIIIYERYGEVEVMSGSKKTYPWRRTFMADVGEDKFMQVNSGQILLSERGVELSSEDWEGHPYWEFSARKVPGRWLGLGIVETLFEPQIRLNELTNLQAKSTYWAALRLFQSRAAVNKNLKTDVKNGEVLDSQESEIIPIDMSDRNLAFFNEELQKWKSNINDLTLAFAPIGKSVVAVQVALDQVVSYFEQIQENVALQIKEMLYDAILPQFEKDTSPEHTLRLVGQDLDVYISMVKNELVNNQVMQMVMKNNGMKAEFPSNHDRDVIALAVESSIKQGKEKVVTLPKGFYNGLKYDIDIDITGESVDTKARSAAKMALLQAITADPTMTTDPIKKKFLASYMEDANISPDDFLGVEPTNPDQLMNQNGQAPQGRAGGGVSAPQPTSMPSRMTSTV